ncbi:hypothetical protein DFS34DRAFT_649546 [Phlyctochytrium arcticum]|nr:hypothetical protein DFS34DRAFT_649546 [Phlyctochytrium arcticum]
MTVDKCQGVTLPGVIIAPLLVPERKGPQRTTMYVAWSRGSTTLSGADGTKLLQPLTGADLEYFQPSEDLSHEIRRLERLAKITEAKMCKFVEGTIVREDFRSLFVVAQDKE